MGSRAAEERARDALRAFWRSISAAGESAFAPFRTVSLPGWNTDWSPLSIWLEMLTLIWSPYDNPLYVNKLAAVLREAIPNFDLINDGRRPRLFVCATNIKTNERKLFSRGDVTEKALLASACLPLTFQAIQAEDGNVYWDGGYTGNRALSPLLAADLPEDIIIVWVNPLTQETIPVRARAILDRLNELTFNSSLVLEINTIETLNKLVEQGALRDPAYKRIYLHRISDEAAMRPLGYISKSTSDWNFLVSLHDIGYRAADEWLKTGRREMGRENSPDIEKILKERQEALAVT
jgi:NTE family protein